MNSFSLDVPEIDLAGAEGIDKVNRFLLKLVHQRIAEKNITKVELARRLNTHRSKVSRLLRGNQNITARTIGELLWALDFDFDLVARDLLAESKNWEHAHPAKAATQTAGSEAANPYRLSPSSAATTENFAGVYEWEGRPS